MAGVRQRRLRPRRAAHASGPVDHLDHASYEQFFGGKLGIDATRKLPTEGYHRAGGWPAECVLDAATAALVDRRWREYGIGPAVTADCTGRVGAARAAAQRVGRVRASSCGW